MDKVFIYRDQSNVFIGARDVAEEREGRSARYRVRIDFKAMIRLAHALPISRLPHKRQWKQVDAYGGSRCRQRWP